MNGVSKQIDTNKNEDATRPIVPLRKRHIQSKSSKTKEDGLDETDRQPRLVAIIERTAPIKPIGNKSTEEKSEGKGSNVTKIPRPSRPPPPAKSRLTPVVMSSINNTKIEQTPVSITKEKKVKPPIPPRPILKESIPVKKTNDSLTKYVKKENISNVVMPKNENLLYNKKDVDNDKDHLTNVVKGTSARTPKPTPRKKTLSKPIPPTPQPRKSLTGDLVSTAKTETSLKVSNKCKKTSHSEVDITHESIKLEVSTKYDENNVIYDVEAKSNSYIQINPEDIANSTMQKDVLINNSTIIPSFSGFSTEGMCKLVNDDNLTPVHDKVEINPGNIREYSKNGKSVCNDGQSIIIVPQMDKTGCSMTKNDSINTPCIDTVTKSSGVEIKGKCYQSLRNVGRSLSVNDLNEFSDGVGYFQSGDNEHNRKENTYKLYDNVKLKSKTECSIVDQQIEDLQTTNIKQTIKQSILQYIHSYENVPINNYFKYADVVNNSREQRNAQSTKYRQLSVHASPKVSIANESKIQNKIYHYNSCDNLCFDIPISENKGDKDPFVAYSCVKQSYGTKHVLEVKDYNPNIIGIPNNKDSPADIYESSSVKSRDYGSHLYQTPPNRNSELYQMSPDTRELELNGTSSNITNFDIYQVPTSNKNLDTCGDDIYITNTDIHQVPTTNRNLDSYGDNISIINDNIYQVPPNNKNIDTSDDISFGKRCSFTSSDISNNASTLSSSVSITSNSSYNSYVNVDIIDEESLSKHNSSYNPSNNEMTQVDTLTSPARKQQRTYARRLNDDNQFQNNLNVSYMHDPSSYVNVHSICETSIESDETSAEPVHLEESSTCISPTEMLQENEVTVTKEQYSVESYYKEILADGRDENVGKCNQYFQSQSEDEDLIHYDNKKQKRKLFSIASEILTTERSFVEGLQLICEDFGGALKNAIGRNIKLLPEGSYSAIFLNIEQIYELDKKFLQELEERMQNWDLHERIGDLVREYGHFLKMYTVYIKGYDSAILMFHECLSNNMKFLQIVEEFEKSRKAKNMKLSSFLLKPIQRIPSYKLLLKDYLQNLPIDHLDYNDISDGLDIVSEVASYINESMKEGEKFEEVLRIQSLVINSNNIVKPGRYLIKEGSLQKSSRKELQQRTFILFTDVLFYCSQIGNNQLKLINELPLAGMIVQTPDSQEATNEFVVSSTKRSFLLNANSPKERDDWVEALQSAITIVNKKMLTYMVNKDDSSSPHTKRKSIQNMSQIGEIAPPWIPDTRVTMCQICTAVFTVTNRRHHCRGCGKVVCNDCSSYEAPLKYSDNESDRVCSVCYTQLLEMCKQSDPNTSSNSELSKFKVTKRKRNTKSKVKALPSTLTEVAAQEEGIEISGFLKITKGKKEKRCWFVLKDHVLYMYKASSDPAASSTIPILGYQVRVVGNWDEDEFLFTLSHQGVKEPIIFRAETRTSSERWLHCLLKATDLGT